MPMILYGPDSSQLGSQAERQSEPTVVCDVQQRLSQHAHFRNRHDQFQFHLHRGRLTIEGRVPSFYLKQVLQEALRDVDGVDQIDNRVEVVSPYGLSSEPVESASR